MNFPVFFKHLTAGSTVYSMAYSEGLEEKAEAFLLLTSELGVAGGTIHAIQMIIKDDKEALALPRAVAAEEKMKNFLKSKSMIVHDGLLLTAGLHDALRFWGRAVKYNLSSLEEMVAVKEVSKTK